MLITALVTLFAATTPGQRVVVAEGGFSFVVPEGYLTGETAALPITLRRAELEGATAAVLTLQALPGPIARDAALNRSEVEKAARESAASSGVTMKQFTYEKTKWGQFEVDRLITSMSNPAGDEVLVFATQVPLKRKALQVQVAGAAADRARLLAEHQEVIDSIVGDSNWLTDSERSDRLGQLVGTVAGFACCAVVPLVLVVWLVRRRRTPRS